MRHAQMPAQYLAPKPAFEAHNVIRLNRSANRDRRRQRFRHGYRRVRPEAAQRMMHGCNQATDLIDTYRVFPDVTADNVGDQAGIDKSADRLRPRQHAGTRPWAADQGAKTPRLRHDLFRQGVRQEHGRTPELARALNDLDTGDELVIAEWDRATRSMWDGLQIINAVIDAGAAIKVLDRSYIDLTTPMGRGFMAMMSAMAEDERFDNVFIHLRVNLYLFYNNALRSCIR
jgi:Resolvase, N terminal domain